jgi:multidrug/hemolysin transport system ATP-binding protein
VVDDLSFTVPSHGLFAFLGQNGAGKSTTINMLIGLLKPDTGSIVFDDSKDFAVFKNRIGVVFQSNIFDDLLTVEENLTVYGTLYLDNSEAIKQRLSEVITLFGMEEYAKRRFGKLSGGQKRKVEVARALFTSPDLLFLDEPTTGLDPRTRAEVWEILNNVRLNSGMTIFLTTHYLEEAADADYVVIIHKGQRVCAGSPAELKALYSKNRVLITPNDAALLERQLASRQLSFTKTADTYEVPIESAESSIELLYEIRENVRFYEAIKGSIDDVFLNVIGEEIVRRDA